MIDTLSARPPPRTIPWGLPLTVLLVLAGVTGFVTLLVRAQALPEGVVPVAWDKEACAHCRMHVGEKGFAAQLQLADGTVHNFDDPGCLFLWLDGSDARVHAIYSHHHTEDRWLAREQVGFIEANATPMGFGLAAVDGETPGAIGWDQAAARIRVHKGGAR